MTSTTVSKAAAPGAPLHDPGQFLTFSLGGEMYAVGILRVKEIIEYRGLTQVPMMSPAVRGVINLRGAVVPVMDPVARFGRPPVPATKRTCFVIVEVPGEDEERQVVGMVVDAVSEVIDIAPDDVEPPPPFGAGIRGDFIQGIARVRGRFVILLDTAQLLSIEAAERGTAAEGAASLSAAL